MITPVAPPAPPAIVVAPPSDTISPGSKVTSSRCTAVRCVLNVLVSDRGFSTGIRGIKATVRNTSTRSCLKNGRKATCIRTVASPRLGVSHVGRRRYQVIANKLPAGTHAFTIRAIDRAGNVQRKATRKVTHTKGR